MFSRTMMVTGSFSSSPSSLFELRRGSLRYRPACLAEAGKACEGWWSQTGSNRRPHACKARALPAELWPRNQKTNASREGRQILSARLRPMGFAGHASLYALRGCATRSRRRSVVGLGRLELPTSRLSSARSNQLSYKPLTRETRLPCAIGKRRRHCTAQPLARVRPRRKRNEDGEIPPMELNNPETVGP
jgi:hypothetical protein